MKGLEEWNVKRKRKTEYKECGGWDGLMNEVFATQGEL